MKTIIKTIGDIPAWAERKAFVLTQTYRLDYQAKSKPGVHNGTLFVLEFNEIQTHNVYIYHSKVGSVIARIWKSES